MIGLEDDLPFQPAGRGLGGHGHVQAVGPAPDLAVVRAVLLADRLDGDLQALGGPLDLEARDGLGGVLLQPREGHFTTRTDWRVREWPGLLRRYSGALRRIDGGWMNAFGWSNIGVEAYFRDFSGPIDHVLITAGGPHYVPMLEMSPDDVFDRLEDMGYGPDVDFTRFHYAFAPDLAPLDTREGAAELDRWIDAALTE